MKRRVIQHAVLFLVFVGLIGGIHFMRFGGFTAFAVYSSGGVEGQTNLILQTAGSDNLGDVYVAGDSANTNFNNRDYLLVKWGSPKRNAYLNFNLSAIPSGQVIDSASLCLYMYDDQGTQTIGVYQVYNSFDETTLTWNNQPCGTAFDNSTSCNLTALDSQTNNGTMDGTLVCWNVLNSVNQEYNSFSNNVTFALHTFDEGYADNFYTKEYTDASLIPYLNITYSAIITNSVPIINIVSPADDENINYNESIGINYSVSDADGNINSCWYEIDGGNNVLIDDCTNLTFDVSEGNHSLNIYANDSYNEIASDSVLFNVSVLNDYLEVPENDSGNETGAGDSNESTNETIIVPSEISAPESSSGSGSSSGGGGGSSRNSADTTIKNSSADSNAVKTPENTNEIIGGSLGNENLVNTAEVKEKKNSFFRGLSGFSISDLSGNTLGFVGGAIVLVLAIIFVVNFLYKHHRVVSDNNFRRTPERKLIKIDVN